MKKQLQQRQGGGAAPAAEAPQTSDDSWYSGDPIVH
jgi:hypothetical protein